jgi:predicted permease
MSQVMLLHDIRYALRGFRRDPAFTAVVAVSIALGIAANTTVFSMVNGMLLGALPVRDPGGLYGFSGGRTFPYPDYREFREQCGAVFEGLAGHFPLAPASLAGGGSAERVWGQLVSGNYFQVTGAPIVLGRGITPEDDAVPGRNPVVVLASALWRRRFGAEPSVLGRTVLFNGRRYTVVGVTAPGFYGTDRGFVSEFWAPLAMTSDFTPEIMKDKESRNAHWIVINGRLRGGVSRQQAVASMNVVHARIHESYHKGRRREPVTLTAAGGIVGGEQYVTGFMTLLMVVVGLVLLVACANVANLLLARAVSRQHEIGIRLAIGAGRGRLIRQLLTESVLLAGLGAAGGFVVAFFAARAISSFRFPIPIPIAFDLTPDHRVLAFTAALAVFTGILFGLAPALAASRPDLVSALKNAGPGFGRFHRFGLRNLLVGVQVTLSAVLLIGAGLFLRSLQSAASMDLGIRPENVLMMAVDPKTSGYSEERVREFLRQFETRVTALPGARSTAAVNILPLSLAQNGDDFRDSSADRAKGVSANVFSVTARYFETIGTPLVAGRDFRPGRDLNNPVVVVNQRLAQRLFGDQDPIGRRIVSGSGKSYEIIGIAGNSKSVTLGEETTACVYRFLPREPSEVLSLLGLTLLVKTSGDPGRMIRAVREQIEALDPNLAVFNVDTMTHHVAKAFLLPRICALLFGVFGLLGLTLASVGLYGVVSYSVRSRTREIGIRMALGARPAGILRLVLQQGLAIVSASLVFGLGLAFGLSRFTASLLYGISATDAATFVGVPVVLLAAALLAVLGPARRAASLEPMRALRFE